MDVQISKSDNCRRRIEIKLSEQEYAPYLDKTLNAFKKNAQVSGFRPGKVPIPIVKKMYGDAIEKKTLEDLVPDLLDEVAKQHDLHILRVVGEDSEINHTEEGLELRFTVEVSPEVTVSNYSDFEVERIEYVVSDDDVAEAMEGIREQQGWLEPVESGAAAGHIVVADMQQVDQNGLPLIGHKYDDREIVISEYAKDPADFTPQLLGVKAGDTRLVRAGRRQDGKPHELYFNVMVKDVSERKVPELDDELARDLGELNSLDELRAIVRSDLERQARNRSREEVENQIVKEIILRNPLEVPASMVAQYAESYKKALAESFPQLKAEEVEQAARLRALRDVRWHYLLGAICEAENLHVSDAEIREYIMAVEEAGKGDAQRQLNRVMNNEEQRERLRGYLREHKLFNLLLSKIRLTVRKQPFSATYQSRIVTV